MAKRINVEPWVNVGHEQNMQSYIEKTPIKLENSMSKIPRLNKCRAFNKAIGPGKKIQN